MFFINVLMIEGGDGSIAREVCNHAFVMRVEQCEIDEAYSHLLSVRKVLLTNFGPVLFFI